MLSLLLRDSTCGFLIRSCGFFQVRQNPGLLTGSLAPLVRVHRARAALDFDNKRAYFRAALRKLKLARRPGSLRIQAPFRMNAQLLFAKTSLLMLSVDVLFTPPAVAPQKRIILFYMLLKCVLTPPPLSLPSSRCGGGW